MSIKGVILTSSETITPLNKENMQRIFINLMSQLDVHKEVAGVAQRMYLNLLS